MLLFWPRNSALIFHKIYRNLCVTLTLHKQERLDEAKHSRMDQVQFVEETLTWSILGYSVPYI